MKALVEGQGKYANRNWSPEGTTYPVPQTLLQEIFYAVLSGLQFYFTFVTQAFGAGLSYFGPSDLFLKKSQQSDFCKYF